MTGRSVFFIGLIVNLLMVGIFSRSQRALADEKNGFGEQIENLKNELSKLEDKIEVVEETTEIEKGLSLRKPNYLLPLMNSSQDIAGRQNTEIKFQISFKQFLGRVKGFDLFGAYTQKSMWRMFDQENSRPFRETNYNPEIYFRSPKVRILKKWVLLVF